MSTRRRQEARPLFVVSGDYGELGFAMNFLRGQECATRAVLALPDRLYADHEDLLPHRTYRYASVHELLELVDRNKSNVVLLFSGYLLSNNGILPRSSVADLVQELGARGCTIVTSDPFLGLAPELMRQQVRLDVPIKPWLRLLLGRQERRVAKDLPAVSKILAPAVHVYHRAPEDWTAHQAHRSVAFFNPHSCDPVPPAEKRWLFVLGSEDADWGAFAERATTARGDVWLEERYGSRARSSKARTRTRETSFAVVIARLLEQAAAADRRATLVAPRSLIATLPSQLSDKCDLVPFCAFPQFADYVLRSEYAFYWNVFSASVLPRLARGLPTFFFDRGHMARLIRALYDRGVTLHYGGTEPTYLDPRAPLDAAELARVWKEHGLGNRAVLEAWSAASPTPDELLARLCNQSLPADDAEPPVDRHAALIQRFEADIGTGRAQLERGCWGAAVEAFARASSACPDAPEAHRLLGKAATGASNWELAARSFARVAELGAATVEVLVDLGDAHSKLRETEAARQAYEAAIELDPDNAEAHVKLGSTLSVLGSCDDALAHCARAAELAPGSVRAHMETSRLLCLLGRANEAVAPTRRAIELGEATPLLYMRLGRAHAAAGDVDAAVSAYERAAALVPGWSQLQRAVGNLLAARHKWEQAAALYLRSVQCPGDDDDLAPAIAPAAIVELVTAAAHVPAYVELGRLLEAAGKSTEAALVGNCVAMLQHDAPNVTAQTPPDYAEAFARFVAQPVFLLELGTEGGRSLMQWRDAFKLGTIVGIGTGPLPLEDPSGRIHVFSGRCDRSLLDRITAEVAPGGYDIVIERPPRSQETTLFDHVFDRHLRPGGVYVMDGWRSLPPSSKVASGMAGVVERLVGDADAFERVLFAGDRVFVFKKLEARAKPARARASR